MRQELIDTRKAEELETAQERCDRILRRIEPFVSPRRREAAVKVGRWRRGVDLPDDSNERYRFEFYKR